jgi:hypothetical protein
VLTPCSSFRAFKKKGNKPLQTKHLVGSHQDIGVGLVAYFKLADIYTLNERLSANIQLIPLYVYPHSPRGMQSVTASSDKLKWPRHYNDLNQVAGSVLFANLMYSSAEYRFPSTS